ncbi:hypothetical protein BGZ68_008987 [Mortierella alpina]|nr:hypothetical protein BGZ68_008987 [Mortierella alpina]
MLLRYTIVYNTSDCAEAKSFSIIVVTLSVFATLLASGVSGLPIAAEKRYDLDNLVHDVTTIVTRPQAIITGNHDHTLHGKLIDCGIAGIFDSRTTEELQRDYDAAGCKNTLGPFQLITNAQNQIAVIPDENGVNHSIGRFDLLGTKKHPSAKPAPKKD